MFQNHLTLPLLNRGRFYCFPESAGHYITTREHEVRRPAGAMQEFNFHFVVSGQGYIERDGKRQELGPGDCFLYFPGDKQAYGAHPEHPWEIKWIHFYGSAVAADLKERGFHRSVARRLRTSAGLEARIDELLGEIGRHKLLHPSRVSMLTYGVLAEFIEQAAPMNGAGAGPATNVERMLALLPELQASAAEPFELDVWAARAGTNRYAFCRLFRRAVGQTPLAFLTMCRIQRAKALLVERPELGIGEIARRSGYETASYFNKRFQESENMTPTAYRQRFAGTRVFRI
ncbi:AraC family transcriptional regulator [Paenibacillus lycopersici]|uniref:AraC family transcriptional regulator n=1 Tax=Paenibacillus lycopersici TaxID=2704462 RepID=A0A6C0G5C4_9BACL|nr:helix-turn-helix domain-containing protein [Paenibacillus lycopersici]QHT62764.1 AraC family transcriptional regulator [Paenibacillus lycopersici]